MADIFVSYAKSDKTLVEELGAFLMECGYTVWWDTELIGGKDFREEIHRQIDSATAVIVVWSKHSRRSDFVIDEADVARRQNKLISTLATDLTSDGVPLGFRTAHHVPVQDAEGLLLALGQKGLSATKPVSAYVLRLFKQRLGVIAGSRRYRAPALLALLGAAVLGAGSIFLFDGFREVPTEPRQRLQLSFFTSFDGSKNFLLFHFHSRDTSSKRNAEAATRVANIDFFFNLIDNSNKCPNSRRNVRRWLRV